MSLQELEVEVTNQSMRLMSTQSAEAINFRPALRATSRYTEPAELTRTVIASSVHLLWGTRLKRRSRRISQRFCRFILYADTLPCLHNEKY